MDTLGFEGFRALVEDAPDIITRFDRELRHVYVNPALTKSTGLDSDSVIGKTHREIGIPEELSAKWESAIRRVFESGETIYQEFSFETPNGTRWYQAQLSADLGSDGRIQYVLSIARDITNQKHTQMALEQSEKKYRQLVEGASVGIYSTDRTGNYLFANSQCTHILGYTLAEYRSMNYYDIIAETHRDSARRFYYRQFMRKIPKTHLELPMHHKDGSVRWISQNVSLIQENSEVVGFEGIAIDITDGKHAEEELKNAKEKAEELSKLKSAFLANMSHEIRTPMTGILGFASLLEEQLTDPDLRIYVERISRSGHRLMSTLNAILDLSKIESQKLDLTLEAVPLAKEASLITEFLAPLAAQKDLHLRVVTQQMGVYALVDRTALGQIINNLVGNALKFTHKGGVTVEIDKEVREGTLWSVVRVADTGIGIAADELRSIFEEFHQAEPRRHDHNGVGLGLTISRKLVELLQGEITVSSQVGTGTTFTLRFPPAQVEAAKEHAPHALALGHLPATGSDPLGRVLLVEDRLESRELMQLFLRPVCKVDSAETAEQALRMVKQHDYDVILMDVNLGAGMDGLEVVRELRGMPRYHATPIAAVTAYAMKDDRDRCLAAGCDDYLSKPLNREALIDLVRRLFAQTGMEGTSTAAAIARNSS